MPGDVLISGDERAPRRVPRRVLVVGLACALLVVGTVVGVDRYRDHRASVLAAAAAFALADTVHSQITLAEGGVQVITPDVFVVDPESGLEQVGPPPSSGRFVVPLQVVDDTDGFTELRDVQVTGAGVSSEFDVTQSAARAPGLTTRLELPVSFDCGEVAAGRYPLLTGAVALLVPESGRVHRVTVPLTSSPELALEACRIADPAAVPEVSLEEQHGRLLVLIENIPRSRLPLRLLGITSPGFALKVVTPVSVPPETGGFYDVRVRVTDCAVARTGSGTVILRLAAGTRRWTVVAADSPASSFRRPGSTWLRRVVERACP